MMKQDSSLPVKLLEKLSSIRLFFWVSIVTSLDFYLAVMAVKGGIDPGFKKLNHYILIDWVDKMGGNHPIIMGWLIVTIILVTLFAVNISARVLLELRSLFKIIKSSASHNSQGFKVFFLRKTSVLLIHFSVVFMIIIHLASSVTGSKVTGPVLEEGKIIKHESLDFPMKCLKIRKSATKYTRPLIILQNTSEDNSGMFRVPGWYMGSYYDVKAGYYKVFVDTAKGSKAIKKIGLKLHVHRLNVTKALICAAVFCFLGFCLHMGLRPLYNRIFSNDKT